MLEESPATAWLPAACSAILLTHPCGTDPLLGLFVANVCVTATLRATKGERGAAAPQLKSQALAETSCSCWRLLPQEDNNALSLMSVPFVRVSLHALATIPLVKEALTFPQQH